MKILYVATISNTVNAFLVPHIKMLVNQGHQVDVAFNIKKPVRQEIIDMGCRIYNLEFNRSPTNEDNYTAYKKIGKLLDTEKYDIVHTHTPVASVLVRLACRKRENTKVIYTVHGFHFYKGAPLMNWLMFYLTEKWLSRYTDYLITLNEEDYNSAIDRKFKTNNIKKVHGVGIDLSKFQVQTVEKKKLTRKEYGYKEKDFILFYAAELNDNKNQQLLIDVINILKNKISNLKLLLAGSGPLEEQYEKKVKQLKLGNNIEILGSRKDIPNLLMLTDVVVASSKREGLPVNIVEAMATGLPLVVTNVRGHRDLINNDKNGYLLEPNDIDGFVKSIEKIYKDEELSNKLGIRSFDLVQKYSLDNVLEEMQKIYTNIEK